MRIIVFDTETINVSDLSMFDFGFIVIDTNTREVLEKGSFLVEEVYNSELFPKAYYYNKNKEIYENKLKRKEIEIKGIKEIRDIFNSAIKKHDIELISGFIINFDIRTLNFNFKKYLLEDKEISLQKLSNRYEVIDISILFSLLEKRFGSYVDYCVSNDFVTEKGNIKSTAEVIYKYITGNIEHEEEHTAFNDSEEEAAILNYCITEYSDKPEFKAIWNEAKEITIKNNKKAWQILK